jgi:glycosyltransferase involved in cell wall biosynthesis
VKAFAKGDAATPPRLVVHAARTVGAQQTNVTWKTAPMSRAEELAMFRAADVCLLSARWDGVALAIYDAIGLALPVIAPDAAPWNEHVRDGLTGFLVKCTAKPKGPGGIPDVDVAVRDLADAIRRLADRRVVAAMTQNQQHLRDSDYDWERTKSDYVRLLEYALTRRR